MLIDKYKMYKYNNLKYADEQELENILTYKENDDYIIAFKVLIDKIQVYWASKTLDDFIVVLTEFISSMKGNKIYIEFIPDNLIDEMRGLGFEVASEYIDLWNNNLDKHRLETSNDNNKKILLRELKQSESKEASSLTKTCKGLSRGFYGEDEKTIREWYESENSKVFVAQSNNEIVGVSLVNLYGFESEKGIVLWIRLLAVKPEYQHQGIGRSMLNYSIKWGLDNGAVRSFIATDAKNNNALSLYEDLGYVKDTGRGQINMEN